MNTVRAGICQMIYDAANVKDKKWLLLLFMLVPACSVSVWYVC
jgi:hypothetical protein